MTTDDPQGAERLRALLQEKAPAHFGAGATVSLPFRQSEGASRETWSFDVTAADGTVHPLILKRDPLIYNADGSILAETRQLGADRITEARLLELSRAAGVPAPAVAFCLEAEETTTPGVVMERLQGETLGRRILREASLAEARRPCIEAAARIHAIPLANLPPLKSMDAGEELDGYYETMRATGHPYPGFEYGFRWLRERIELAGSRHALVHGDFRNGNILVGPDGLRGVLDWERAHVGNPLMDLGWICVRSWRYGQIDKPVGGFGEAADLLAGYQAAGGPKVSLEALHYWEVFGTLLWGILCITMAFSHLDGPIKSMEKAAIGRRTAETEYDLLQLL